MKVYRVEYYWNGAYGAYEQRSYVVFARTSENAEKKVVGKILAGRELNQETEFFYVKELDPMDKEVFFISEKSN